MKCINNVIKNYIYYSTPVLLKEHAIISKEVCSIERIRRKNKKYKFSSGIALVL